MQTRPVHTSSPGPRLPVVLREIADRLIQDNWSRYSTSDRSQTYYIVGCKEQEADVRGEAEFSVWEFPSPTVTGPLSKSVVRSQLAAQRNYFEDAHKKLKAAGASASCIDAFLRGDVEGFVKEFRLEPVTSEEDWLRLLIDSLEAARLRDGNALVLDKEEAVEASIEREKNCLGQIAKKYTKVVDRWEKLEPLEFVDTQIQEASETFLYGFYRASFLLCASAVESQLKRIAHQSAERVDVPTLMRIVQEDRELDSALLHACKGLFNTRNLVAHANHNPTFHEVEQTLGIARWIVAELRLLT